MPIEPGELARFGARLAPPVLAVEVNDRCTSRCGHCSYGRQRMDSPLLDLDRLLQSVRDAYNYGSRVLTVAAREPFLPETVDRTIAVLSTAWQSGFTSLAAITSARFLQNARSALAQAGLELASLDVSVDGYGVLHDQLRRVREWKVIEEELKRENYREVTRSLCASVTLQRNNADHLIDLLDWLADGPKVDAVLIATVSMSARNDPGCGLIAGQFTDFLARIEDWYAARKPVGMQVALEITPDSVPEICHLAKNRILDPKMVQLGPYGFPILRRPCGLPVRIVTGIFSLGRVLRIEASGRARLYYAMPEGSPSAPILDLSKNRLSDLLEEEHRSGRILSQAVQAAQRRPEALRCAAWPFHLERCPTLPDTKECISCVT